MKIVILGALGYIGSALIELYREESEHEILAVDKKFVPILIANLPDHVSYTQADILDTNSVKKIVEGADIVYMMAAEVEAEKSKDKKDAVWKVNYEGAMGVADLCGKETRFIFPSTGNVFGGVDESVKFMNLDEKDEPTPRLPYAESKVAVEKHLMNCDNDNYTIVRFGTNYGYSPGVRFNLVTNIFVKKALQGEPIMLHGGGRNYRPTVHVMDAAGAAKYLAALPEARGQIYHAVCNSYRICELAETIEGLVPGTEIHTTDDAVPFNSYHLSNKKLIGAGYEFKFDLESGVRQMLEKFGQIKQFHR
ncbi:MAG: NAD(P)-dependent oxidoreductase [Candidatus Latescibacteria bacterium]|nr:NAD(P)-dependent oxidoreductase [Candidatus Latescibacterota bacterium]